MVEPPLRIFQIQPVEPQRHYHHILAIGVVYLSAHGSEKLLVYRRMYMWLVEVYMLPRSNEPIQGLEKKPIP